MLIVLVPLWTITAVLLVLTGLYHVSGVKYGKAAKAHREAAADFMTGRIDQGHENMRRGYALRVEADEFVRRWHLPFVGEKAKTREEQQ